MFARRRIVVVLVILCCVLLAKGDDSNESLVRSKRGFRDWLNNLAKKVTKWTNPEVCYCEVGCFDNEGDFKNLKIRPVLFLPESPEQIKTAFILNTRGKSEKLEKVADILNSAFSGSRPTKVIIHGYQGSAKDPWVPKMSKKFLDLDDFNVILVDWHFGAISWYTQATSNTRVVGAQIALLLNKLIRLKGAKAEDIHIIGHSLGAHIAGYVGMRTKNLGRISGLDPAEPYFQYMPLSVRLDATDAQFVDVIHTDADPILSAILKGKGGFGTLQPSGHVDFYPNGGFHQPGCGFKDGIVKIIRDGVEKFAENSRAWLACDHLRVVDLYLESIEAEPNCWFTSVPCPSYDDFKNGKCKDCGDLGCSRMGYYADKYKPDTLRIGVTYYMNTNKQTPFCITKST